MFSFYYRYCCYYYHNYCYNYYYHYLMANLLQIPSSSNSDFHCTRRSMREQNILFRRQNSIIYSPFTRSGFLKSRLNQPSVNGNSCFPFVAFLGQELLLDVYFSFIILNNRRSSYEQSTQALTYSGVGIWFTYSGAAIWFTYSGVDFSFTYLKSLSSPVDM